MAHEPYTLEQAEEDIADLRGQVDALTEYITTTTLSVAGAVTATGGTPQTPSVVATDSWNNATAFLNGWTGTLAVMLLPLLDLAAVYAHLNCAGATTTDGTNICTTFNNPYHPANTTQWMPMMTDVQRAPGSNPESAGITVAPNGQVQCQGIAVAATWVRGTGLYRLSQ